MRIALMTLWCAMCGCAAASTTGLAIAVGAVNRANGECYGPCVDGTACNKKTGTCDPIPCRGRCQPNEKCEQRGLFEHCVPAVEVQWDLKPASTATP